MASRASSASATVPQAPGTEHRVFDNDFEGLSERLMYGLEELRIKE